MVLNRERTMQLARDRHASPLIADALRLTDIERLAAALTERVHRRLIELDNAPTSEAPQAIAVGI